MSSSDWSNLEELAALGIAILTSLFTLVLVLMGILWSRTADLDKKIDTSEDEAKAFATSGDGKIWDALNAKEVADRQFRETTIGDVKSLPTKKDMELMEARLVLAVQGMAKSKA